MSALDQNAVLARLQELSIAHENHAHEAVMTCDAQAAALGGVDGVGTKNLFLIDKRRRLYIVTAAVGTKVNLNTLSARLGTGKGGVRMAPDALIPSVLQVALGSVTPLAIWQPAAAGVVLLLDRSLREQQRIFVHPLDNRATTVLSAAGLEACIRAAGREPIWVDLGADPVIDRDNPPDLRQYAEAAVPLSEEDVKAATAAASSAAAPAAPAAGGKKGGKAAAAPAAKAAAAAPKKRADDVLRLTDELVAMVSGAVLGDAAAASVDSGVLRRLKADVAMELNILRNAAYAGGFAAAKGAIADSLAGKYA